MAGGRGIPSLRGAPLSQTVPKGWGLPPRQLAGPTRASQPSAIFAHPVPMGSATLADIPPVLLLAFQAQGSHVDAAEGRAPFLSRYL